MKLLRVFPLTLFFVFAFSQVVSAASPSITTGAASNIAPFSATLNASAPNAGTSPITQRGFEYGQTTSYTDSADEDVPVNYPYSAQWGNNPSADGQFMFATDVATDSDGNVYTADSYNRRIQKFDSSGNFITKWGSIGNPFSTINCIAVDTLNNIYVVDGDTQRTFKYSSSGEYIGDLSITTGCIAFDSVDNIYVGDSTNHVVKKYDSNGTLITQWGSQGSGSNQFESIDDFAIDTSDNVYVIDRSNNRIQKFDSSGNYITQWGSFGNDDGQFHNPINIAIDSSNHVFVIELYGNRVQKFSSNGAFLGKWGSIGTGNSQFDRSRGIAVDSTGNVYVGDTENGRIQEFDNSGSYLFQWGHNPSADGQFSHSSGVVTDSSNNIYVVDTGNNRIQKFDSDGNFLTKWGSYGSGNGQLNNPIGIAIDYLNNIYVADTLNNRIQKFSSSGTYISQFGSSGSGNNQFSSPKGVSIDSSGNIFVADTGNHRIQKFNSAGTYISQWGSLGTGDSQFNLPISIAVDASDNVYIADRNNNRIQKFDNDGVFILKWGSLGSGNSQFNLPGVVSTSSQGYVFVFDGENRKIKIYDENGGYITKWGQQVMSAGGFDWVQGISINSLGELIMSDGAYNRIQKYTQTFNEGDFSADITDLECNTTYHYRAYAINNQGTSYGDDATFQTSACPVAPTVETGSADFSDNDPVVSINIISDGGAAITSYGVDYGLTDSYDYNEDASWDTTAGEKQISLHDIQCDTTYHYRAYAINNVGMSYGEDRTFTAPCPQPIDLKLTTKLNEPGLIQGQSASYTFRVSNVGLGNAYPALTLLMMVPNSLEITSLTDGSSYECSEYPDILESPSVAYHAESATPYVCGIYDFALYESGTMLLSGNTFSVTIPFQVAGEVNPSTTMHALIIGQEEIDSEEMDLAIEGTEDIFTQPLNNIANYTGTIPGSSSSDSDPIPDSVEDAAPGNGDGNNDGTPDSEQSNVTSLPNASGDYITLAVPEGVVIDTTSIAQASTLSSKDIAYTYPLGLVSFTATTDIGATIPIELYFYTSTPPNSFTPRKYNTSNQTYTTLSTKTQTSLTQTTINNQPVLKLSYQLTDGGPLDQDNTANGTIIDPVGLAQASVGVPNTGL